MLTETITHREVWLDRLMPMIREHFNGAGYSVPSAIRLTCGWPHKGGVGQKKRRIGECWDSKASTDDHFQIFISPTLDDLTIVVGTLIHEVVHAVVGLHAGHKKPFSDCAKAVGLTPKWTATGQTDELKATIKQWTEQIGPYPHGALRASAMDEKKEKGRMLLLECECGLKIRSTQKWIDEYGTEWPCPCGSVLHHNGDGGPEDGE